MTDQGKIKIWKEIVRCSEGITNWWVQLPGEPARCCGDTHNTTEAEALALGQKLSNQITSERAIEDALRIEYPEHAQYSGSPARNHGIDWERAGIDPNDWSNYIFILKRNRRDGLEQIQKAVKLS